MDIVSACLRESKLSIPEFYLIPDEMSNMLIRRVYMQTAKCSETCVWRKIRRKFFSLPCTKVRVE